MAARGIAAILRDARKSALLRMRSEQAQRFSFQAAKHTRHCEPTGRANAPDDRLREAIHGAAQRKNGLLRCARNDVQTHFRIPAARCARSFARKLSLEKRGSREYRVHAAPAVSCAKVHNKNAHEHTGSAEAIRHSLRNGFTAYIVLSPAIGLSCHRRQRCYHRRLDAGVEASGPHVFAVRSRLHQRLRRAWYPSAEALAKAGSHAVRLSAHPRPPHPASRP